MKKKEKTTTRRQQGRIDGDLCFSYLIADRNINFSKVHLHLGPCFSEPTSEECLKSVFTLESIFPMSRPIRIYVTASNHSIFCFCSQVGISLLAMVHCTGFGKYHYHYVYLP
jgi:hypothetical protein